MIFTQGKKLFFQLTCPFGQVQGLFYFSRSPAYLYMYLSEKTLNKKLLPGRYEVGFAWKSMATQKDIYFTTCKWYLSLWTASYVIHVYL